MPPINCRVQGSQHEPLPGLHVILECFKGHVDTFDAFTSSDGIIESWLPFTGTRTSPGDDVPVDSYNYSTYRMSFSPAEPFRQDIYLWPYVQVDVRLHPDSCYAVSLHYTFSSYHVEIEPSPQFLLEDEIFEAADLIDLRSDATYQPSEIGEEPSLQAEIELDLSQHGMEVDPCSQGDLDKRPSLQHSALEDSIIVPPPDVDSPPPKKRGRPRKTAKPKPTPATRHIGPAEQVMGARKKRGRPKKKARAV